MMDNQPILRTPRYLVFSQVFGFFVVVIFLISIILDNQYQLSEKLIFSSIGAIALYMVIMQQHIKIHGDTIYCMNFIFGWKEIQISNIEVIFKYKIKLTKRFFALVKISGLNPLLQLGIWSVDFSPSGYALYMELLRRIENNKNNSDQSSSLPGQSNS